MKFRFLIVLLAVCTLGNAQDPRAYRIFDKAGNPTTYEVMVAAVQRSEVALFGELHNNALAHWLQLRLLKDLHHNGTALTLGMEMFEADVQVVMDEYLSGLIEDRHLESEARVWNNYKTDYKPLVVFAKEKRIPIIATNIPRRYANLVYRKGPEALMQLDEDARQYMMPLPLEANLELPGYQSMITQMGGHAQGPAENLAYSQASKDATMGYFILENRRAGVFLHLHGAYHSRNYEGIYWYLIKGVEDLNIITIETVEQEGLTSLEEQHLGVADFVIAIPHDMTKTY